MEVPPVFSTDFENNNDDEVDAHFIIRFPEHVANQVRNKLNNGQLGNSLLCYIDETFRQAQVKFEDFVLNAKVVDLPTITECAHTITKTTLFKDADICQMMLCELEEKKDKDENDTPTVENSNQNYSWPHGITPPLKNVRKKRFNKVKTYLEDELRTLIKHDNAAEKVHIELLIEETQVEDNNDLSISSSDTDDEIDHDQINEEHLFGSNLSSDYDKSDESEREEQVNVLKDLDLSNEDDDASNHNDTSFPEQNVVLLKEEYSNLKTNYMRKLKQINTMPNPTLRLQLESSLSVMLAKLKEMEHQIQNYEPNFMKQEEL